MGYGLGFSVGIFKNICSMRINENHNIKENISELFRLAKVFNLRGRMVQVNVPPRLTTKLLLEGSTYILPAVVKAIL